MINGKVLTLGIESSCDETSVSFILDGRNVLSNVISSQISIHKVYGGVVPEIASRHHLENINGVIHQALEEAREKYKELSLKDIDAIGVTKGPGLVGALLIGISVAKVLAFTLDKPLIGIHHILGHIGANYIEHKDLEPPFMALIVSGGHTSIVDVKGYNEVEVLGETRDDAIGEAYDKVARVLSLPYPGGPEIDKLAKEGNPSAIHFKRVFLEKESLDFSFSGIKTGVLNFLNSKKQQGQSLEDNNILDDEGYPISKADIAASFQEAVLEVIVKKAIHATKKRGEDKLILAGGVAANSRLREMLNEEAEKVGIKVYVPSPILCTDNGAMIGAMAYFKYMEGNYDNLFMDAKANLHL